MSIMQRLKELAMKTKAIEPNHVELALYAASVECASARGVEVSRVRVLSRAYPILERPFFDGVQWRKMSSEETFHSGLVPPEIRSHIITEHQDLDLVAWLHFDSLDEKKEAIGDKSQGLLVMKATKHEWGPAISYMKTSMTGCSRCQLLQPTSKNFHAWLPGDPTCQYCGEEWTGKNEGQACKGFAPLTACEYRLEPWEKLTQG